MNKEEDAHSQTEILLPKYTKQARNKDIL
jgi:hypothetical protein